MMDTSEPTTLDRVVSVVSRLLGIEERRHTLDGSTPLFGAMPELDSMAVVELVSELEVQFGIEFDDDEITEEAFESLGNLAALVDEKRR